jgi:AraC family transcriptional regulator of adaptative response / DNA-3-methyladenine glycosylase II
VAVLARRDPFDAAALLGWLAARAVPGVEAVDGTTYARSLRLPRGDGLASVELDGGPLRCTLELDDVRDADAALAACERLLDLACEPAAVAAALGSDPLLGPLVGRHPGLRCPGAADGAELALRAVLGQQVSLAAAATLAGRLTARLGRPLRRPLGRVTHRFVTPAELLAAGDEALPMPRARARALLGLAAALEDGLAPALAPGADPAAAHAALLALPGIGPWTAGYVLIRAVGDRDVWLDSDLGVRHALAALPGGADAGARSASWAPLRSYATQHLWQALADGL